MKEWQSKQAVESKNLQNDWKKNYSGTEKKDFRPSRRHKNPVNEDQKSRKDRVNFSKTVGFSC